MQNINCKTIDNKTVYALLLGKKILKKAWKAIRIHGNKSLHDEIFKQFPEFK